MKKEIVPFEVSPDESSIHHLTQAFFHLFTNTAPHQPCLEKIYTLCLPQAIIIKKSKNGEEIYTLETFIEPRQRILSDGTLSEFEEYEISSETKIINNLAQRYSNYKKRGYWEGKYFEESGHKLFQFLKTQKGWRISSVIWEDEAI